MPDYFLDKNDNMSFMNIMCFISQFFCVVPVTDKFFNGLVD